MLLCLALWTGCGLDLSALSFPEEWVTDGGICIPWAKGDAGMDEEPMDEPDAGPVVVVDAGADAQAPVDAGFDAEAATPEASAPEASTADSGAQDAAVDAVVPVPVPDAGSFRGVHVTGRNLADSTGALFVPRGPELVTASLDQLAAIDQIAASGANSMRMLLTLDTANGMTPQAFDQLLGRAVARRLVVWVSLFTWDDRCGRCIHSSLGGGNLRTMADYLTVWQRPWLKALATKYQGWLVIDAMQEFISVAQPPQSDAAIREWVNASKAHIQFFRSQGFSHPLTIMTSFQGRDLSAIVDHATEILGADSLAVGGVKQTMFGWQAYWSSDWYRSWQGGELGGTSLTAAQGIERFVGTRTYPIMVGLDNMPGADSYYDGESWLELMPTAARVNAGWLYWTWEDAIGKPIVTAPTGFAGARKAAAF